jgi:hypothetical protein
MVSIHRKPTINLTKPEKFPLIASRNQSTEKAKELDTNKEFCEASNESFSFVDRLRYERLARIHRKTYLSQKKLIFIHNPRTGGQSFATLAYGKSLGHLTASKIKTAIGSDEYENRISIGFVRDPVERLISAYNFSRQGGTTIIKQNRFRRVPAWALERFDVFCREWLFKEKKENLDLVFRSQYLWFFDQDKKLIVNQICDLSKLDGITKVYFGSNAIVPKINESCGRANTLKSTSKTLIKDIYAYYYSDYELLSPYFHSSHNH